MTTATSGLTIRLGQSRTFRMSRGTALAYLLSIAVLVGAAVAGLAFGSGGNFLVDIILSQSASSSNSVGEIGLKLPLGVVAFAFAAGMVSTVNPCGFVMLPTYLGIYVGSQGTETKDSMRIRLLRAGSVSAAVGLGFVVLFGTVGVLLSAGAQGIVGIFPWIGLGVGVLLTLAGGYILGGGKLYTAFAAKTAGKIGDPRDTTMKGYFLFGISYAIASLSCTLPIFLALISASLATGGFLDAALQFFFYAFGMAFVITVLTVSVAMAQGAVTGALRRILPHTNMITSIMLLIAGFYIVFYWLTEGGLADRFL